VSRPTARHPRKTKAFRSPTWWVAVMQRSRRSWTSWSLTRSRKAGSRAQQRLLLLQLETDHQHLLIKELGQRQLQLLHRQQELREATSFRLEVQAHPEQLPPSSPRQELDRLLGL